MNLITRLQTDIAGCDWLMQVLRAARSANLPDWFIGAGTIRNLVWDGLHGRPALARAESDLDLVFFDALNPSQAREHEAQRTLQAAWPQWHWEVCNQAAVHLWYERCFGFAVAPHSNMETAIASWPETATCVAVRLTADDQLQIVAPFGLEDLYAGIVRHNPARASADEYRRRCASKFDQQRWPRLIIMPPAA